MGSRGSDFKENSGSNANESEIENNPNVLIRSDEEKLKVKNVATASEWDAINWVEQKVRLNSSEYYALRPETRAQYLNSVKLATWFNGTDETQQFWKDYMNYVNVNMTI